MFCSASPALTGAVTSICRPGMFVGVVLLIVLAGCQDDERDPVFDEDLVISSPVALQQHVVLLNETTESLIVFEMDRQQLSMRTVPTGREPTGITVSPGRDQVAVLSQRDRSVTVFNVEADTQRTYDLGSAFDALRFSSDGERLLAYFSPAGMGPEDEFFNPEAYAVVDLLNEDPSTAVLNRSLRGFGDTPSDVYFVPAFNLGNDSDERYALFLFDSYVTFADLRDPSFEVTVNLVLSPTDPPVFPSRVMFTDMQTESVQDTFVYMLASESNDVFAINLLPGVVEEGRVRLAPNISQLPSGIDPQDMERFIGSDGREKLITVNAGSGDVALVDAATASVINVGLDFTATQLLLFDADNPRTGVREPTALAFANGGSSSFVAFIRLHELAEREGQAIETLALESRVQSLIPSPVDNQVVIRHPGGGLSVLDLEGRFANPLRATLDISDLEVDEGGFRLFAALTDSPKLNIVNLINAQPSTLTLDHPIRELVWLPKANSLLAFHDELTGLVTAIGVDIPEDPANAAPALRREDAVVYSHFFLQGLFD